MNKRIIYSNYSEIEMPEYDAEGNVMLYLTQWPEIENLFPNGSFFLDKTMCGCGATTLFLLDLVPTILCSPRKILMYSKDESGEFPTMHLYRTRQQEKDNICVQTLQKGVEHYLLNANNPINPYVPKIVVSYDSFDNVVSVLGDKIKEFRIVADETQTLFTDAAYRGLQVIQFLEIVKQLDNVIYMSATPFDAYMNRVDAFQGLPYVKLRWQKISTHRVNIKRESYKKKGIVATASDIIRDFRAKGYFDEPIIYEGKEERSTEAVFYVNSVRNISSIIEHNKLTTNEVNILCADDEVNQKKLPDGFTVGMAPGKGKPHKPFTFCTRAAFEGVDFNSTCAYSYIFSEISPNYNNLALDISYDLPQIMGRQRNHDNHFRYSATFFYKTWKFDEETEAQFMAMIDEKLKETTNCLAIYERIKDDPEQVESLARKYRGSQKSEKYTKDYVEVIDDPNGHALRIVFNTLVYFNELRAWDIQKEQYLDDCRVMRSVDDATQVLSDPLLDKFYDDFYLDKNYERRMALICNFLLNNPQYKHELDKSTLIPYDIKKQVNALWPDNLGRISASSYKRASIEKEIELLTPSIDMGDAIRSAFEVDKFYPLPMVKDMLQDIYNQYDYEATAKAIELESWLPKRCKKVRQPNEDGKRIEGYKII